MAELGDTLQTLQTKLSESSTWQSWLGIDAASTARIYFHEVDKGATAPYIELDWSYDLKLEAAYLSGREVTITGSLVIAITDKVDPAVDDVAQADFNYLNRVTDIMKDLIDAADYALPIQDITLIGGPQRTQLERRKADSDYIISVWSIFLQGVSVS